VNVNPVWSACGLRLPRCARQTTAPAVPTMRVPPAKLITERVEIASNLPQIMAIRDSKDPHGPRLAFSQQAWSAFVQGIKEGEFGL
jgi:Domain of unknown function (DUF397)